jgi:hypothetical protein
MTMTMTMTPALASLAAFAAKNDTSWYLVVEAKGDVLDFPSNDEFGHGRAYSYKHKGAALRRARGYNLRRDHTFDDRFKVYDVRAHALLT